MNDKTQQLIEELAGTAHAVAPVQLRTLCAKWIAGFIAYAAALVVATGVSPELPAALSRPLFVLEIMALIALIMSAALAAGVLSFPDQYQQRALLWLPVPVLIGFITIIGLAWGERPADFHLNDHGFECLACISLYALLPGAWLLIQMRRMASTQRALAGAVAVIASFATGALALRLLEAGDSMMHMLQWHYVPMLGAALIGCVLGKWLLKW